MKSEEELRYIIRDNEYLLPSASDARIVFFDKENDELLVELTVMLASPKVGEEGEILEPNYHQIRHAVRLKLKFSDLFMLPSGSEPPPRDINYMMQKLEEAQERIAELQVSEKRANVYVGLASQTADQCRDLYNKTVPEKFEGTTVLGMFMVVCEAVKEAREEAFDLYHQACYVTSYDAETKEKTYARYDNQCMSCYESVEDKLIEWGLLKPEQCLRRINKEKT